jgi:hypothetical protein
MFPLQGKRILFIPHFTTIINGSTSQRDDIGTMGKRNREMERWTSHRKNVKEN